MTAEESAAGSAPAGTASAGSAAGGLRRHRSGRDRLRRGPRPPRAPLRDRRHQHWRVTSGGRQPGHTDRDLGRGAPTDRSAANGPLPPRSSRPQDEDALDLLSVAGLPLLKRVAPVAGVLLVGVVLFRIVRRRRRASRA